MNKALAHEGWKREGSTKPLSVSAGVGLAIDELACRDGTGWEDRDRIMIVVQGDPDLHELVDTLHAPRGFTSRLNRREKQEDRHGDDCDHDKKLDQREAATPLHDRKNSRASVDPEQDPVFPSKIRASPHWCPMSLRGYHLCAMMGFRPRRRRQKIATAGESLVKARKPAAARSRPVELLVKSRLAAHRRVSRDCFFGCFHCLVDSKYLI